MVCSRIAVLPHLCALIFLLALLPCGQAWAAELQKAGVVGNVQGTVIGTLPDKNTVILKAGDPIYVNQTLQTGEDAKAQLMFLDRSALTIVPNTRVTIDTFIYDPERTKGAMTLQGARGTLRFIGGALTKQDYVTIKTPVSTVGIRGGIMQVSIAGDGSKAEAIFFYGRDMMVANAAGNIQSVTEFGHGMVMHHNGAAEPMGPEQVKASMQTFNKAAQPKENSDGQPTRQDQPNRPHDPNPDQPFPHGGTKDGDSTSPSGDSTRLPPPPSGEKSTLLPPRDPGFLNPDNGLLNTRTSAGAGTGSNTVINTSTSRIGNPNDPGRWGPWAHDIFFIQTQDPLPNLEETTASVTGLPLLPQNLIALAPTYTSFGTVNYQGVVVGQTRIGALNQHEHGVFNAAIDFNTRKLDALTINLGQFVINNSGTPTNLGIINLTGTANAVPVSGAANAALYGINADLLSGKFNVISTDTTVEADGVFTGGKAP